jgi:hypothetical protein
MAGQGGEGEGASRPPTTQQGGASDDRIIQSKAESILRNASEGNDISPYFNNQRGQQMTSEEQRKIMDAMRGIQSTGKYTNVELVDSNNDGVIDNASATLTGQNGASYKKDIYDTPQERQEKSEARRLMDMAVSGQNIYQAYNQFDANKQVRIYDYMTQLIREDIGKNGDRSRYRNLHIDDNNQDHKIDDVSIPNRRSAGRNGAALPPQPRQDVYMTPEEEQRAKAAEAAGQAGERILRGGSVQREVERGAREVLDDLGIPDPRRIRRPRW